MRIAIALSGGVDSAVSAFLLRRQGHEVVAMTLQMQSESERGSVCAGESAVKRAAENASALGLEHIVVDATEIFKAEVLRHARDTYRAGETPNPCLRCNRLVKFRALREEAMKIGCDALATGHYARIVGKDPVLVGRGSDPKKDQSYFLAALPSEWLEYFIFPLGEMTKTEVRKIAEEFAIPSAKNPDSQNVCITQPGLSFAETLANIFGDKPIVGDFIDVNGKVIAKHRGLHAYTVGQRRGLGNLFPAKPAYVKEITGRSVVVTDKEEDLLRDVFDVRDVMWHKPCNHNDFDVQIRYRSPAVPSVIENVGKNRVRVRSASPHKAVTPGQIAVFYEGDAVVAYGTIAKETEV